MRRAFGHLRFIPLLAAGWLAMITAPARGDAGTDSTPILPPALQGVGIDEYPNAKLPLDSHFTDDTGHDVPLGKFFNGKKPVVLQLGYFGCPKLCGLISHGLVDSTKVLGLKAGTDYDMIFLSVHPAETPTLASQAHDSFVHDIGRPEEAGGFHFLVGEQRATQDLADRVGFHFKQQTGTELIAHPAVIFICTPDGHVSRYLYGVDFPTRTLRLSLVEASNEQIGSTMDKVFVQYCYDYDAKSQNYTLAIWVMRAGGILTMLLLGSGITWLIRIQSRARN
jgi:protein SCO1/2